MTDMNELPAWAALMVALLLILGGTIILIGALGLMRLPNFYQRIHGPAITVTLGAGSVLLASMLYFTLLQSRLVLHELIISVFLLMTVPVVSMLLMRAAIYRERRTDNDQRKEPAQDEKDLRTGKDLSTPKISDV
jgi:multicomponent K+:H+ antiporter subunit G